MEGDSAIMTSDRFKVAFQSTPSAWRETVRLSQHIKIFPVFQSTPSAWRETSDGLYFLYTNVSFQSTPSAWRETLPVIRIRKIRSDISIHSLRMEGDGIRCLLILLGKYFNPLPPHGGRLILRVLTRTRNRISIHSLRMEGDLNSTFPVFHVVKFQSTPSAWRETGERFAICGNTVISIHSLRMEGDAKARLAAAAAIHFNPLPPHGGRRTRIIANAVGAWNFNPLPPHGGRQCDFPGWANGSTISIHSLRMEGDLSGLPHSCAAKSFQSTPSAWRETRRCSTFRRSAVFQSTPSAWRETPLHWQHHALCEYFNPLPPHGGRPRRHATDR